MHHYPRYVHELSRPYAPFIAVSSMSTDAAFNRILDATPYAHLKAQIFTHSKLIL